MDGISAIIIGIITMIIGIFMLFKSNGGFNEKFVISILIIVLSFVVIEWGVYLLIIGTL